MVAADPGPPELAGARLDRIRAKAPLLLALATEPIRLSKAAAAAAQFARAGRVDRDRANASTSPRSRCSQSAGAPTRAGQCAPPLFLLNRPAPASPLPRPRPHPCESDDGSVALPLVRPRAKPVGAPNDRMTRRRPNLPTRELLLHSPAFFSLNALDFAYQPNAPEPTAWLEFLGQLWHGDPQSVEMVQETFGLLLTGDTSHQKAFLLVGPKRSGKGTIARVATKLLGQANVCGPTLSSLGQNFGLAPLIGKRLAIISDARLGGKTDQQVVVERILAITGEDSISIDRKFKDAWAGRLETRIMVLTNELPKLADASGALASRFVILLLTNSFYGKEDHGLTDRIIRELPGILNWSLEGWQRLKDRGYFVQPASSAAAQRDFEDLGSPIGAFIRERCTVAPFATCRPDDLYNSWCDWCRVQNISHVGTVQTFGRDLRAVVASLKVINPRDATGDPVRHYQGVEIKR